MGFVKNILFLSNLIFVIAGAALFGLGLAIRLKLLQIKDINGIDIQLLPLLSVFVILVGAIVFVISFLGCCGAIKENGCMLTSYSIFMFILTAVSLAVAIPIFVKQHDVTQFLVGTIDKQVKQNVTVLHPFETTFSCCGLDGPQFYVNHTRAANDTLIIGTVGANTTWGYHFLPTSCCKTPEKKTNCNITLSHSTGCVDLIEHTIKSLAITIGLVLCIVACIELLAAVLGLYVKNESHLQKY